MSVDECPVSYITPRSIEIVSLFSKGRLLETPLYGANLADWPAWAVDAFTEIEQQRIAAENARIESERR